MRDKLGLCQWFHFEDFEGVERAVEQLRSLGVRHLRTGISWADFYREGGSRWYDWQMERLAEFEVLLSIWHTPPSISEGNSCASPPRRLRDYADFIDQVISRYGKRFAALELWNEPNNRYKWDFERFDPDWSKFGRMIADAAHWAKQRGQTTVLGGMMPVDHHWLETMARHHALNDIDIIAIHSFPEMWWDDHPNWDWHRDWHGWEQKLDYISSYAERPVWVTETGLATWDQRHRHVAREHLQAELLEAAAGAPCERVYWYCIEDLDPNRTAIEGFHVDEHEYHLGLVRHRGGPKPSYARFHALLRQSRRLPGTARPEDRGNSRSAESLSRS